MQGFFYVLFFKSCTFHFCSMNPLDLKTQVTEFIRLNFMPSDPDKANFKRATGDILTFLWLSFPKDCISDYELADILFALGYARHTWVEDYQSTEIENGKEITTIKKILVNGYCLHSHLSLKTDVFPILTQPNGSLRCVSQ